MGAMNPTVPGWPRQPGACRWLWVLASVMARSRDDAQPPDGEVTILGDNDDAVDHPADVDRPRRTAGSRGRTAGIVLGVAAAFVIGMVVGRSGTGGTQAGGPGTGAPSAPASTHGSAATTTSGSTPTTASDSPQNTHAASTGAPTRSTSVQPPAGTGGVVGGAALSPTVGPGAAMPVMNPAFTAAISTLTGSPGIESMAVVGKRLVLLGEGTLVSIEPDGHDGLRTVASADVGLPVGDPTYAPWQLISDGTRLWAYAPGKRLYDVDPATLELGDMTGPPSGAVDAATLDGHLYLNTETGVVDMTAKPDDDGGQPVVARGGQVMTADPGRHRLLVLNNDDGWGVTAYTPPGFHPGASTSLPLDAPSIAVVDGAIWVAGTAHGGDPSLTAVRLDPTTLHVATRIAIAQPASAPRIVAHGRSLWLRDGNDDGALWCVDPHDGTIAQQWTAVPGAVAVGGGHAYVVDGVAAGELRLNGSCTP